MLLREAGFLAFTQVLVKYVGEKQGTTGPSPQPTLQGDCRWIGEVS